MVKKEYADIYGNPIEEGFYIFKKNKENLVYSSFKEDGFVMDGIFGFKKEITPLNSILLVRLSEKDIVDYLNELDAEKNFIRARLNKNIVERLSRLVVL